LLADENELLPQRVSIHAGDLESAVTLIYPRVAAKTLSFVPSYFAGRERMPDGVIELTDQNGNRLSAARLSRSGRTAELRVALETPHAIQSEMAFATDSKSGSPAHDHEHVHPTESATSSHSHTRLPWLAFAVILVLAVGAGVVLRARRSGNSNHES
jgi:hypothetical protein